MLIRKEEQVRSLIANMRGGDGSIDKRDYLFPEMPENAKMFAEIRLEPGCSIGMHQHTGEYEVFFCKEGEIILNDNGEEKLMHTGDFAVCRDGEMHGIPNRSDSVAATYAVIIKTK